MIKEEKYVQSIANVYNQMQEDYYRSKGYRIYTRKDGAKMAVYLVDKPVQPGQVPWQSTEPYN